MTELYCISDLVLVPLLAGWVRTHWWICVKATLPSDPVEPPSFLPQLSMDGPLMLL